MFNISAPTARERLQSSFVWRVLATACALSTLALSAAGASAATVTVLGHSGRTHQVDNRFLTGSTADAALPATATVSGPLLAPVPDPLSAGADVGATVARESHLLARKKTSSAPQSFQTALMSLSSTGQIPATTYRNDLSIWNSALAQEKHMVKWRRTQLTDVTALLDELASRKQLSASRLPVLIVMLSRNAQYWRTGKQLVYPDRVQFSGSELVWEYYPGYGLQFQVLGTFGEGDGYYEAGAADYPKLLTLMDEVQQMAVTRAGGIAWEYYFNWEGGAPPWVSAMAQATGIEALTNAYLASSNHTYLTEAHSALGLFGVRPPTGTAIRTTLGTRYLQYSFAPRTDIINAYLQSLLGLYDYAQVSSDPTALALYNAGNAQAQAELRSFIINGWSLYQPGVPDNLNYHELVTGFLQLLCRKTAVPVYCQTYAQFTLDLKTKPTLEQLTMGAKPNRAFSLSFYVSKYADIGVTLTNGKKNFLYKKVYYTNGTDSFVTPKLPAGTYTLSMSATDPAGNYANFSNSFKVCASGCAQTAQAKTVLITAPPVKIPTTTTTTPTTTGTTTGTGTTTTPVMTTTTGTTTTPVTTTTPPTTTTVTATPPTTGGSGL